MNELELIVTADGSHSLYIPKLNETYHSTFGAWSESEHIYINNGLLYIANNKSNIAILEIGFGTGLNALQSLHFGKNLTINYSTLEPFPISKLIINQLNYTDNISIELFYKLHDSLWNEEISINPNFKFIKYQTKIQDFKTSQKFDVVYFDAFAPDKQPEMWTTDIFSKLYQLLNSNGILISYCSKGLFKNALKEVGFRIEKLEGPKGKREIIRATKI